MPQIVKKRRSGWAVLAAGALVASLLAVGAAPAAAIDEDSTPDSPAPGTACLGAASADAGFTDTDGLGAEADINCLAYYGITTGKTADTFDPNSDVTRSQMALFLSRAAALIGVDLMEGDVAVDFGDIADEGEERSNAITALARNGILAGRSDMAFEPAAAITRTEMAVALVALLDHTPGAPVHKNKGGLFVLGDDAPTAALPDDSFGDAGTHTRGLSQADANAISAAYELGVTTGKSLDVFDPTGTVPRKNMASFITRAMSHSNLRPAGLTAQVAGGTITVSVRDADFAPVVNQTVDAFKTAVAFESKAFKDDGTCSSRTSFVDGATKCEVDGADPVTDSGGNSNLAQLDAEVIGKGLTVWLWAGDVGDKVGSDTDLYEMSVVPDDTSTPDATSSALSNSVAMGATKVHFSQTVTVTVQLKGDPDATDADNDLVDVGPGDIGGEDGISYSVVINKRATSDGSDPTNSDTVFDTKTISVSVGDDGAATFEIDANDTSADTTGNRVRVDYTVTGGDFSSGTPAGPNLQPTPNTGEVIFSDETAVVTAVTVDAAAFQNAPGEGSRAGSAATVTVADQFARPFKGAGIIMTSDNSDSVLPTRARITGSNGQVRIGYSYTGGASDEDLTATYPGPDGEVGGGDDVTGETTAYWVSTSIEPAQAAANVLSADLDDNQVIVDDTGGDVLPMSVNYDSGDYFTVDSEPATYDAFEEALGKALARNAELVAAGEDAEPLTLAWASYVYDDPSDIAQFTLVTG